MTKKSMIAILMVFLATCIFSQVVFADEKVTIQGVFSMQYLGYDISSEKDANNWLTKQVKEAYKKNGYKSVKFVKMDSTMVPFSTYDYDMILNWITQEDWPLVLEDGTRFGTWIYGTNNSFTNINFTGKQDENGKWYLTLVKQCYNVK